MHRNIRARVVRQAYAVLGLSPEFFEGQGTSDRQPTHQGCSRGKPIAYLSLKTDPDFVCSCTNVVPVRLKIYTVTRVIIYRADLSGDVGDLDNV